MRLSIEFSLAGALAVIIYFVASKNNALVNGLLLVLLSAFLLHPLLSVPWIANAQSLPLKIWKVALVVAVVLLAVGRFGLWVWPAAQPARGGESNAADYPHIQFKTSEEYISQSLAIPVTVACFRNDSVAGRKLPFSAQVIYKNAEREVANVARATWFPTISKHPTTTAFDTGITRSLGVFFFEDGKLYKPLVDWFFEGIVGYSMPFPRITREEFTERITSVEIRFLSGNEKPRVFVFDVNDYGTGKFPTLSERP